MKLLMEKGGTHLMKRDERGEGGQGQKGIEEQGDDITHHGHGGKSLVEDIGKGDEDERRTAVGIHPYRERRREDHQSGKDSYETIYHTYLDSRPAEVGLTVEIGGVGTDATHGQAQRIESLPQGTEEDIGIELTEIGMEKEGDTLACSRKHTRGTDDDEQ